MILQSIGDVTGRVMAPGAKLLAEYVKRVMCRSGRLQKKLPLLGSLVLPVCFLCLLLAAVDAWSFFKTFGLPFGLRGQQLCVSEALL